MRTEQLKRVVPFKKADVPQRHTAVVFFMVDVGVAHTRSPPRPRHPVDFSKTHSQIFVSVPNLPQKVLNASLSLEGI